MVGGIKNYFYHFLEKQQKWKKNQNFEKSFETSRGITITKLHTKFHWATTNSLDGRRSQKLSWQEEEEEEEETPPGAQNGRFWQVIKIEPFGISTCGFQQGGPLGMEILKMHSGRHKPHRKGGWQGRQNRQLLRRLYSTRSAGPKWEEGRRPLSRSLDH